MNRNMRSGVVAAVALLALSLPHRANTETLKSCTNASWDGSYGFKLVGERIGGVNAGPRAAVGKLVADGRGNLSGTETKSNNGYIQQGLTFVGIYNMLTDCTGSASLTIADGEVRNFNFILIENGEQVLGIETDDGRVKTMTATRQKAK
jgi:hypothetical protein